MKNDNLTLFIDLDGTVYDKHNGMWEQMSSRIDQFMRSELGIPEEEIIPTRNRYYAQYGSTLRGIQIHHAEIDVEHLFAYVHDLELDKFLVYDPDLRYNLKSIPYPKWIFTNSDRNHASRILRFLGLEDLFEGILDMRAMNYVPKPDRSTYLKALALAGSPDPARSIFVEDTVKNLAPARLMGWQTVWIDAAKSHPAASYCIPKLHYLPDVIDQIEAQMRLAAGFEPKGNPVGAPVFAVK